MKNVIYKYKLTLLSELKLPKNAEILSIGEQFGNAYLWAKIDLEETVIDYRVFLAFSTGCSIPEKDIKFIGTVFFKNGLVYHVFEKKILKSENDKPRELKCNGSGITYTPSIIGGDLMEEHEALPRYL